MRATIVLLAISFLLPALPGAGTLDIYVIDVEGGKAMLVTTPDGQAMLIDAGWPGIQDEQYRIKELSDRDTDRIIAAIKTAGVKQLDYFVVSHYDMDHVGNVPRTAAKMPVAIRTFVDHGPVVGDNKENLDLYAAYMALVRQTNRISLKPGDTIPITGLEVRAVTSGGAVIREPLAGAGTPNEYCTATEAVKPFSGENPASLGLLFQFGKFRMIDLADLTKDKERELMCPRNPIGTVDLFMASHHAFNMSNSALLVDALHPRVAIINNGETKGGQPEAWQIIRKSPGLEDIWQVHYAARAGKENNAPENFIANFSEKGCQAKWIKVSARPDGTFTVTNSRNKFSRTYKK